MRTGILGAVVLAATLVAAVVVITSSAQTSRDGLPPYVVGWERWSRINREPIRSGGPHAGVKEVYASKPKAGRVYPNGTVIVKAIVKPGARFVGQLAAMRKMNGSWRFVEWERPSPKAPYRILAQGALCQSCHAQARANDYVFTRR